MIASNDVNDALPLEPGRAAAVTGADAPVPGREGREALKRRRNSSPSFSVIIRSFRGTEPAGAANDDGKRIPNPPPGCGYTHFLFISN